MNYKKLALVASFAAAVCFTGCGDDSSTSANVAGGDEPAVAEDSQGGEGGEATSEDSKGDKTKS
ncbi:MAG: hypothetical protein II835_13730, partial [Fibrobacter sp.]|nr:hypothetical protein [Fibrobacter sp.]